MLQPLGPSHRRIGAAQQVRELAGVGDRLVPVAVV
jgi:hypothetical protein